jgi:hypothetical protein
MADGQSGTDAAPIAKRRRRRKDAAALIDEQAPLAADSEQAVPEVEPEAVQQWTEEKAESSSKSKVIEVFYNSCANSTQVAEEQYEVTGAFSCCKRCNDKSVMLCCC